MQQGIYHVPVLLQQVIEGLNIDPSGVYVDCTFGGGGHSKAILAELNTEGRLVAFDQDEDAKKNIPDDERIIFIPQNFRHLQRFLRLHKLNEVNGILADLGVSSYQFDNAQRGFSTRFEGDLDMRMDRRQERTALDIIRNYPEEKLHKIFEQYGEITNSKTLAKTIVEQRAKTAIETITNFKNAVHAVVKGNPNKYFAQVFQALRIEVNDELGALRHFSKPRFITNCSEPPSGSCFFTAEGSKKRPFASNVDSNSPIKPIIIKGLELFGNNLHKLTLFPT